MPIIKRITYLVLCAVLILGMGACRSSKKAAKASDEYNTGKTAVTGKSLPDRFSSLTGSYSDWTDLRVPVKIQIAAPGRTSLSGVAMMRKDECIYVSIRMLGFEVGSLYADNESVQVIVKALGTNMYWTEPLSVVKDYYGLSIGDIQSLLMGRPFLSGSGTISASDKGKFNIAEIADSSMGNNGFTFSPKKLPEFIAWTFTARETKDELPYLAAMSITPKGYPTLDCTFGAPLISPAGSVTPSIEAGTKINGKEFELFWNWSFDSAKWNTGLNISKPQVSKSATKVETEQLLKMLKTL